MNRRKLSNTTIMQDSAMRELLSSILLILVFVLLGQIQHTYNERQETGVDHDIKTKIVHLHMKSNTDSEIYYIEKEWLFVPDVTSDDIMSGKITYSDLSYLPNAENIEIDSNHGWKDLGEAAVWNTPGGFPVQPSAYGKNNRTISAVYAIKIHVNEGPSYFISIPNINGKASIFCNGLFMGDLGDVNDISKVSFSSGFSSIPLFFDENGYSEIMIAVESNTRLYNPGILTLPAIGSNTTDNSFVIIPTVWLSFITTVVILTIVGGMIIFRTFTHKKAFFVFISMELLSVFYALYDMRYIVIDSLGRIIVTYTIELILGCLIYVFISSLFHKKHIIKKHKILKYDHIIVLTTAFILVLIPSLNKNIFGGSYTPISALVFCSLACIISILKVLFVYINDEYSYVGLIAVITMIFVVINMHNDEMRIYNITTYSIIFTLSYCLILVMFLRKYVRQYKEIRATSEHLQYLVNEKTAHISEINRDLYNTNKRLMENEEARKNVLSNVSHDLRTPITAIRGYAELLSRGRNNMSDDQVDNYLSNIMKRSVQMERIVSDIVELTKMESSSSEFKFSDISLAELLDEICMMYSNDLQGTSKKLTLDMKDDDLLIIRADYKKICRVFENLISNAINYTGDEATIRVKAWREGKDAPNSEQSIHVTVSDNGIGIPEDEIEHIFDRFYRAKNSGGNIKGTGLGLSIVKTIIDHHKASITVKSALGAGTEFHITIPVSY